MSLQLSGSTNEETQLVRSLIACVTCICVKDAFIETQHCHDVYCAVVTTVLPCVMPVPKWFAHVFGELHLVDSTYKLCLFASS